MFKRVGKVKLGKTESHRRALVQNQLRSLFRHGEITTTTPKAKLLKSNADSLISRLAKDQDEHVRKNMLKTLFKSKEVADNAYDYISKNSGSNVSIVKVGYRDGDNAQLSKVTLPGFEKPDTTKRKKKKVVKKDETKPKTEEPKQPSEDLVKKDRKSKLDNLKQRIAGGGQERARARSGI